MTPCMYQYHSNRRKILEITLQQISIKAKQLFQMNFMRKTLDKRLFAVRAVSSIKPNIYSFHPLIAIEGSKDLSLYYNSYPKQLNPSC